MKVPRRGTIRPPVIPPAFDRLVDRYRIKAEVGTGGRAAVYLADDVRHRRQVAIKVLKPEISAVIGRERFLREIEIAARLNHPHIVPSPAGRKHHRVRPTAGAGVSV
jgi:hypothetical protein